MNILSDLWYEEKQKHYRILIVNLEFCPRNFLQMADSDIIVSLHLVVPFISFPTTIVQTLQITLVKSFVALTTGAWNIKLFAAVITSLW
jgi:hypothetical protein